MRMDREVKAIIVPLLVVVLSIALIASACAPAPATTPAETPGKATPKIKYEWKFASEEVEGDYMTVWANKFAEEMEEWSNGQIKITVYPYGSIGGERDINELCQMGEVQFVFSDYAWISSFVPQAQVFGLHYLWPKEKVGEVVTEVCKDGKVIDLLEEKFREKGFVPLAYHNEGWQWWTSNRPIKTPEDIKGWKVRVMSSKILIEGFKAYGASPTPLDYGEVYGALQRGMIDGQTNPMFAIKSMGFYEPQEYLILPYAQPFISIPSANRQFFDSLPEDVQEKMKDVWMSFIEPAYEWTLEREEEALKEIKKEKPGITIHRFNDEQIEAFKKLAMSVRDKYPNIGGKGASKILDTLLNDIERAKGMAGVK